MAPNFYFALNTMTRSKYSVDQLIEAYKLFIMIKKLKIFDYDHL
jgi:hypothetical protein